jgi:eukaryotic-like serine/threonine-protein kinase
MAPDEKLILGGRYEVIGVKDCGTLADIRLAFDTVLHRKVAVKLGTDGDWEAGRFPPGLFEKEARMAAALQHPHLLPVYDYGIDGGRRYLVMRDFDETLREFMRRFSQAQPIPLDVTLPLFQGIAGAIDYLHDHAAIVHGNLKPNNIVLDAERGAHAHPFVSDFGVAAVGPHMLGTPIYAAPEQFSETPVSGAADLFALGIILYQCLTGALPFAANGVAVLMAAKLQPADGQYSVRRVRPELPVGVDLVIDGLTRPDPRERYGTASAAIDELARAFYSGQAGVDGTVFVSYAREDSAYVHALARRLRSIGVDVWADVDIEPGKSWDRSVEEALRASSRMVVVMSAAAAASETVRDEWSYFIDHDKPVYAVIYEPCELPLRLRRRQHITSTRDILTDVSRILSALAAPHQP